MLLSRNQIGYWIEAIALLTLLTGTGNGLQIARAEDPARSSNTFANEPSARARYDKMITAMQQVDSLSFASSFQREAVGQAKTACTYRVWLKKPNFFRVETESLAGEQGGVLIGDGTTLWIYWPNGRPRWENVTESDSSEQTRFRSYMTKPALQAQHSIWHEVLFLGGGMSFPCLELSTFHGYVDPITKHIDGVRSIGTEPIGDEICDGIEVSMLDGQRRTFLWISRKDHLPRKLREVVRVTYENIANETWTSLQLNKSIPDSKFRWTPPEDWVRWQLPSEEEALLDPGTQAPDFTLSAADDAPIKLSDFRGKTVWLCFWRLGCPPCRKETPLLQALHEKHKGDDLVVLGINVADDKQLIIDYLKKYGVSYPNVIDSSETAQRVCEEAYKGGGVPLNYLIDRDGKVVTAAFEYAPVRAALSKLRPDLKTSSN